MGKKPTVTVFYKELCSFHAGFIGSNKYPEKTDTQKDTRKGNKNNLNWGKNRRP